MSVGAALALLLGVAAAVWVTLPALRRDSASEEEASSVLSEARELHSQHEMLVASLRDLEDDRAIYKESEEALKRQIKTLNDNNLQNEKIQFRLKHDID